MCRQYIDDAEEYRFSFRYHDIVHEDMKNGDGLRVVLFVSGCSHRCPECQNPVTWDCNYGVPFTPFEEEEIATELKKSTTQGITLSGGDPLFKSNREPVGAYIVSLKKRFPNKDVWLYTGYKACVEGGKLCFYNEAENFSLPWVNDCVDVVVDGPFDARQRKKDLEGGYDPEWRGSSNQRVIDVRASISAGTIVRKQSVPIIEHVFDTGEKM